MTGPPRRVPSVLHLDLDAFFAAVEQRDKPSLHGRPVVVGGTGPRGVVATASYEARAFGIFSAMPTAEARRRCPRAAVLAPRFRAYAESSEAVMDILRATAPQIEPLSLDEAYVDLESSDARPPTSAAVRDVATQVRRAVARRTGLTASIGAGTSKLVAKIASDLAKPDGCLVVEAGAEQELLDPLPVSRLWGVGPATAQRLHRLGVEHVAQLRTVPGEELVALLGPALGTAVARLARAEDDRAVTPERGSKSISAEDTFPRDLVDLSRLVGHLEMLATRVARRLRSDGLAGRTVTVKVRRHDFVTVTRSMTLAAPTDDAAAVRRCARRLLGEVDTSDGVRLLGVGVSGLTDWAQHDLFDPVDQDGAPEPDRTPAEPTTTRGWPPGQDVEHRVHGRGWVQGSGLGRVTVRLETRTSGPGRVQTYATDDPDLRSVDPEPLGPLDA